MLGNLQQEVKKLSNKKRSILLQGYFKTGAGEYAEGDIFAGLTVGQARDLAIKHKDLTHSEIEILLKSKIHEERLIALLILVYRFNKFPNEQKTIYEFYIKNTQYVNNWDLVDLSAHKIIGAYLLGKPKNILFELAKSNMLWEKRISIISTFYFIAKGEYETSLKISEILIKEKHDLIQKAVGWMLREIGKRDLEVEEKFLKIYYKQMGRTALRYSIEKFPENLRQNYLKGII